MSIRIMIVEDEKETRDEYRMLIHNSARLQLVAETVTAPLQLINSHPIIFPLSPLHIVLLLPLTPFGGLGASPYLSISIPVRVIWIPKR